MQDSTRHDEEAASPIIILGMHRSGTSCLAGSLEEAGLYLGDVIRYAQHNLKGNNESKAIMQFHESLLAANGGSWDDPPETAVLDDEHRAWRDRLLTAYPAGRVWGFKDPRTMFTLDCWLEALGEVRFAGTFRHPIPVSRSLGKRNNFPIERSVAIWETYNRRMLEYHERFGFEIICFDWEPDLYRERLHALALSLGLEPSAGGFEFFEPELRSWDKEEAEELPQSALDLYGRLRELAA